MQGPGGGGSVCTVDFCILFDASILGSSEGNGTGSQASEIPTPCDSQGTAVMAHGGEAQHPWRVFGSTEKSSNLCFSSVLPHRLHL